MKKLLESWAKAHLSKVSFSAKLPWVFFVLISSLVFGEDERLAELDLFWEKIERTIQEGDFDGYAAACHPEGILVSGIRKTSYPLRDALAKWKKEFVDTKSGVRKSRLKVRFSQRLGDGTTAHETGIFSYSFEQDDGGEKNEYVHFEILLRKKNDSWLVVMEHQKALASKEEWLALEE